MKTTNGREQSTNPYGIYRKSRNNLFGARLIRQQSPAAYLLENQAEASFQAAATLELRPQAAVGSSWAASLAPALTATLTSRSLQQVQGVADSVAVITLSSGQVVRLSRSYGLLEGPQWLSLGSAGAQWSQAFLPTTVRQPAFSPLTLFAMQPGDELGYLITPAYITPYPPSQSYLLRHILTRRQTADSLVITNSEQRTKVDVRPIIWNPYQHPDSARQRAAYRFFAADRAVGAVSGAGTTDGRVPGNRSDLPDGAGDYCR